MRNQPARDVEGAIAPILAAEVREVTRLLSCYAALRIHHRATPGGA